MTFGEYIGLILTQDAAVAAVAGERVYSEVAPDDPTPPFIVFDQVSADEDEVLEGGSGVRRLSASLDCWARTRAEATRLAAEARRLLRGHAGAAGGLEVQGVFLATESWDFDPETRLYRTSLDFEAWVSGEGAE